MRGDIFSKAVKEAKELDVKASRQRAVQARRATVQRP